MTFIHTFASDKSFLDQQTSKDGTPYGPKRFKEIVKEIWYITDNTSTSYSEVLDMSFQERFYFIECINQKQKDTKDAIESIRKNKN